MRTAQSKHDRHQRHPPAEDKRGQRAGPTTESRMPTAERKHTLHAMPAPRHQGTAANTVKQIINHTAESTHHTQSHAHSPSAGTGGGKRHAARRHRIAPRQQRGGPEGREGSQRATRRAVRGEGGRARRRRRRGSEEGGGRGRQAAPAQASCGSGGARPSGAAHGATTTQRGWRRGRGGAGHRGGTSHRSGGRAGAGMCGRTHPAAGNWQQACSRN